MSLLQRRVSRDEGTSVMEVVVASALFFMILAAVLSSLDSGTKHERVTQARQDALLELREAMGKMTREVRQATVVHTDSTQRKLHITTLNGTTHHEVTYEVVGDAPNGTLQRKVGEASPATIATRVVTPLAFCYQFNDPTCVATTPAAVTSTLSSIRLSLSINPVIFSAGSVALATDVHLRNLAT